MTESNLTITKYKINHPLPLPSFRMMIGIDPGVTNLGIATCNHYINDADDPIMLYQIKTTREKDPVDRILKLNHIISACIVSTGWKMFAVVEGASYNKSYRQVELESMRTTMIHWCLNRSIEVKVLAPTTIRKVVFGNGRISEKDVWKEIPSDVASALACMYAGIILEEK